MEATATPSANPEQYGANQAQPLGPATNETLYRFSGTINPAVPSQQAFRLWLAAAATMAPLAIYTVLVVAVGAWLLFAGLIAPLFNANGYGLASFVQALAGVALYGLAWRPFVLTHIDPQVAVAVSGDAEVDLQGLVNEVADHIGVAPPDDILLSVEPIIRAAPDCQGAVPGFARIRLVVGVPVLMTLTQRELGGAIAHELAHFAEPESRRVRQAVVATVVTLRNAAQGYDGLDGILLTDRSLGPQLRRGFARFINAGRWPLKVLFPLTQRIAQQTINEVEFHADWFQTELVGAEAFRETAEKLQLLAHAHREWLDDVRDEPMPRYPSDLARVIYDAANRQNQHRDLLLRDAMLDERTLVDGPHAACTNRIDRVRMMCYSAGILNGDLSSAALLLQPAVTARQATLAYLREGLRLDVADDQLLSEAAISRQLAEERELGNVLDQYLLGFYLRRRFLPPGDPGAVLKTAIEQRIEQIESLCEDIRRASPEARNSLKIYDDAVDTSIRRSVALARARLSDGDEADTAPLTEARRRLKDADRELVDAEQRYADRLALGVATALSDAVRQNPHAARDTQKRYARLVGVQAAFAREQATMLAVREALAIAAAFHADEGISETETHDAIKSLATAIERLRRGFRNLPDPLSEQEHLLLTAVETKTDEASDGTPISTAAEFIRAMEDTYLRVMVQLAEIALATEKRHGIRLKLID
ncbi:MAG: hypothetical protein AAFX44_08200 [Pseudomonadota bacterium]